MDAANAQKILGYFIEEAKEHLETLEQGILNLEKMPCDSESVTEQINEMFRAAHSVKGGAAMLGYTGIQKTAHRLEDAFKILKENRVQVDKKLESLFLEGCDILKELIEKLQGPFGLQADEANAIVGRGEPIFAELQTHLGRLLSRDPEAGAEVSPDSPNTEIRRLLREMLQVFKREDSPVGRQQLQKISAGLLAIERGETGWQALVNTARAAIANLGHSYYTLAPVVISELKLAGDLLELDRGEEITVSFELQQLADARAPRVLVPLELKSLAGTLLQMFDRQQVSQLIQLLRAAG